MSVVWALVLPAVGSSLYFHAKPSDKPPDTEQQQQLSEEAEIKIYQTQRSEKNNSTFSTKRAVGLLWNHFRESYSDLVVVQWSLWWALAMCGFTQVYVIANKLNWLFVINKMQTVGPNVQSIPVGNHKSWPSERIQWSGWSDSHTSWSCRGIRCWINWQQTIWTLEFVGVNIVLNVNGRCSSVGHLDAFDMGVVCSVHYIWNVDPLYGDSVKVSVMHVIHHVEYNMLIWFQCKHCETFARRLLWAGVRT